MLRFPSRSTRVLGGTLAFFAAMAIATAVHADAPTVNSVATIISDMTLKSQERPHGIPASYAMAQGPHIGRGNNPKKFTAMTAWGQLYESAKGNPATNTRVNIKDIQAYYLSKSDGTWHQLQSVVVPEGGAYVEDFSTQANKLPDLRKEPDGTISVTAGGGRNFHFYPPDRTTINPADIAAIFTTCQARLIVGDPALPDDRASAKYVLEMAGDYWLNQSAQFAPDYSHNADIANGRFKCVTTDWQAFNMCTATPAQLKATPPPLE